MPCLILTGHPCIGKSTFTKLLSDRALLRHGRDGSVSNGHATAATISRVAVVTDTSSCPDRSRAECYESSTSEKVTRAALKSDFEKSGDGGSGTTLVLLDSLNYIKGYRYELYCISKEAGERHGVVWISLGGESSDDGGKDAGGEGETLPKKWNRLRREAATTDGERGDYYADEETMDALVQRYEPPNSRWRWEDPLYKVDLSAVLPWNESGTLSSTSNGGVEETTAALAAQKIESPRSPAEVLETPSPVVAAPTPALKKKSASGFKRNKKVKKPKKAEEEIVAPAVAEASADTTTTANATKEKRKIEDVIDEILDSFLLNVRPLKEGMSTLKHVSADSDVLNQVDAVTQTTNAEILRAQKAASLASGVGGRIFLSLRGDAKAPGKTGGGGGGKKRGGGGGRRREGNDGDEDSRRAVELARALRADELRGLRRQFLKWTGSHPMPGGTSEANLAEAYVSFIETNYLA